MKEFSQEDPLTPTEYAVRRARYPRVKNTNVGERESNDLEDQVKAMNEELRIHGRLLDKPST